MDENNQIIPRKEILKILNENGITRSVRYHIANKSFIHSGLLFSVVYYPFIIILTWFLQQYTVLGIISSVVLASTALLFIILYILQHIQKEKFRNKFPWKSRVFGMLWKEGYRDKELDMIELHMKFPTVLNIWCIFMIIMALVMGVITSIFKSYNQTDCIFWINCASIIHLAIYMLCFGFTCFNLNPKNSFIERWIYYEIRKYEEKEKNNDNTI